MAIDNQQKVDILLQSFNVLKNDLEANSSTISEIIGKVAKTDFEMSWEMWTYVLQNYDVRVYGNEAFHYSWGQVSYLIEGAGIDKVIKRLFEDSFIRKTVYQESSSPDKKIISYLIDTNRLEQANELLEYVYNNPSYGDGEEDPFGDYLHYILYVECENLSNKKLDFLLAWVERVKSDEFKAKLNVLLLEYM